MAAMVLDNRFDRMERTGWIDMGKIHSSKVFVAGAGALGNEVLKNLVLAGFKNITIADPDLIEESNLSRCVLFRHEDVGSNKAEIASKAAMDLYPESRVISCQDKVQNVDLSSFDIFIGCLDSISARLHMNSHAKFYRIPYIDGATDGFKGKIQVVRETGPCMECLTNGTHANELHRVFSCDPSKSRIDANAAILSSGITTTSIIAGACVREAIKIVCGRMDLCMDGLCFYDGLVGNMELLKIEKSSVCPNHEGEL